MFCLFYQRNENSVKKLVPAMIFVGGFVFHMFWEAKCQYTIPYFVLLIPYAVFGFSKTAEWITERCCSRKSGTERLSGKVLVERLLEHGFVKIVAVFLLVNMCILLYGGGKLEYLREDTVEYFCYLEEARIDPELKTEAYQEEIQNRGRNWGPNL